MTTKTGMWSFGLLLGLLTCSTALAADSLATERRVQGVITALEGNSVTITPHHGPRTVTGRVDESRTRVTIDGRGARLGELRLSSNARAEIGLDDVWLQIRVDTKK
jgi:hypothetical protein